MTNPKIEFINLAYKYAPFTEAFAEDLRRVLASGAYILGEEVEQLEKSVAAFTGANHAVGVANCTDGLILAFKAIGIGPGDEVITSPMSYLATTSTIALVGATAVFVDIDDSLNLDPDKIEDAINEKTKAISLVHLSGIPANVKKIKEIADRHGLALIEDCAQSFGATVDGRNVGTFGRFGVLSFHPLKNFGTIGDGGMILVQDEADARWLRQARNHGHRSREECDFWSVNSRLDELHAAFLRTMLASYPTELQRRQKLADIYRRELSAVVEFPKIPENSTASYNWIMILADQREALMDHLTACGVESKIHYPMLITSLKSAEHGCRIHASIDNANRLVNRILSLPSAEHITETDVAYVSRCIREFYS